MGSSAVPVKKNPIKSERISSFAKILKSNVNTSLENISLWHERDLSNSANERFIIPITDYFDRRYDYYYDKNNCRIIH